MPDNMKTRVQRGFPGDPMPAPMPPAFPGDPINTRGASPHDSPRQIRLDHENVRLTRAATSLNRIREQSHRNSKLRRLATQAHQTVLAQLQRVSITDSHPEKRQVRLARDQVGRLQQHIQDHSYLVDTAAWADANAASSELADLERIEQELG